ncbi:MAG: DUF1932 domain-containing protein [Sneathiellaceae bacterium]
MTAIAVIGMGQMGAGIARRLADRGATVLTPLDARSQASRARAAAAGARAQAATDLAGRAAIVLSVVPPAVAAAVAEGMLPHLQAVAAPPLYLDCNAIAPGTLAGIAARFDDLGLPFGDAAIIGGPPRAGGSGAGQAVHEDAGPRIYMSGPVAEAAACLRAHGLDARLLSAVPGDASALKMSYAGITKGLQALGAARNGAAEALVAELRHSQPMLHDWLAQQLPRMYAKAWRWDGEMREIAAFLEPEPGAVAMLAGAADLYAAIAAAHEAGPDSETIAILDRFAGR